MKPSKEILWPEREPVGSMAIADWCRGGDSDASAESPVPFCTERQEGSSREPVNMWGKPIDNLRRLEVGLRHSSSLGLTGITLCATEFHSHSTSMQSVIYIMSVL